ncbi:MAG: bifunctional phosphoribosyl-AMP cyclohydrolase/phosphoribosyl-ATP diphosphatase HisIE [Gammaproteobacteria bacterium]
MSLTVSDIEGLDFAKSDGLVPVVVQHADSGAVLMVGYMNGEALRATLDRRRVVFWSRSKQRLWEKGEASGNHLDFIAAHADCDRDALLVLARPRGPACHLGTATCFGDERLTQAERLAFIAALERVIERRVAERPEDSYTARLFAQGEKRIAQKVGEEGLEVALAGAAETDDKVIAESADLLYHLLVLLKSRGLPFESVIAELESRHLAKKG